ncbi:uncharacterized protein LOC112568766 isoform X1 [Pomacea canaliculata]|uniref:uncharacterized protein LOC112568766 isoform X1 n=1 Tax=Pomacea canaliculata TaxID=400727 RepID=UPI000D72F597|nr:uncharacterized protein LOC112568766 isoform X1 [Pomacea canaliculata]
MELTLLMMCGVALLAGKCYSDVTIRQCPDEQIYVTEYSNVRLTCGPCLNIIEWYVDDNCGEEKKYIGECIGIICNVDNSAGFRFKLSTTNILGFKSVLDIIHFTGNNTRFVCECYNYFSNIFPPRRGYNFQSSDSCKLLIKVPPGSPQLQCPQTILEGSNVSCTCTSANKGSPPAQFVWDGTNTDTLLLQDVRRELNAMNYTCRQMWGRNGLINRTTVYSLQVIEKKQPPSEHKTGAIVGGVFGAVVAVAIVGTIVTVYIVKRRKGFFCNGKTNLRLPPCPSNFCHRAKPISQSYEVTMSSQTPVLHYVAHSGDIYTTASTTTSGDVNGEYVTVSEITENTTSERQMDDNLQTNKNVPDMTKTKITMKPTVRSKATTGEARNFSDLPGSEYMNVTEVPTDSGLGVYHIVPWAVVPAQPHPDTGENYKAEEEYNVLKYGENRTEQEDQGDTYHHLEHN